MRKLIHEGYNTLHVKPTSFTQFPTNKIDYFIRFLNICRIKGMIKNWMAWKLELLGKLKFRKYIKNNQSFGKYSFANVFFFKTWQEWKQNISFNCTFCNNLHSQHIFIRVSIDILSFWSEEQVIKRLLLFPVNNFLYQTFLLNFWIIELFSRLDHMAPNRFLAGIKPSACFRRKFNSKKNIIFNAES